MSFLLTGAAGGNYKRDTIGKQYSISSMYIGKLFTYLLPIPCTTTARYSHNAYGDVSATAIRFVYSAGSHSIRTAS